MWGNLAASNGNELGAKLRDFGDELHDGTSHEVTLINLVSVTERFY